MINAVKLVNHRGYLLSRLMNASIVRLVIFVLYLIFVFGYGTVSVLATQADTQIPPGFYLVSEEYGIRLYRKEYAQGSPDFVQVIDLSQGAELRLLHGQVDEPRKGKGMFGGDDYRFGYQNLQQFWTQAVALNDKTICVFNGQFFYMPDSPTRLAMPLKVDGELITTGFGYPQYEGEMRMLELWPGEARIRELSEWALNTSSAPNIISGLSERANKKAKYSVGRTFVGVDDRNSDGTSETVLVINTLSATQAHAAEVLRDWGADSVMMLDGGGSTQLYCRDGWKVESERFIPQAIAVVAGTGPPWVVEFERIPAWPVILAENDSIIEFEILNQGTQAWKDSEVELRIIKSPWGTRETIVLSDEVLPGEALNVEWKTDQFFRSGIYNLEISLFQNGRAFPGDPAEFSIIVLPSHLETERGELEQQVSLWISQEDVDIETRTRAWLLDEAKQELPELEPQLFADETNIQYSDVIWVPLLMLPFVTILMLLLNRSRNVG